MAVVVRVTNTGNGATRRGHIEMSVELNQHCFENEWKCFVEQNGRALFQTALLIAADPNEAEAALTTSVNELDLSKTASA